MHEDEDENEKPLVRVTSRKESLEEGRGQAIDDEDVAPLVSLRPSRPPETAQRQKRKGPPVLQDPTAILKQQVSRDSREREEETSIWSKKSDGEARPDITHDVIDVQDERKTSRSQEIDVNSFHGEPVSSRANGATRHGETR